MLDNKTNTNPELHDQLKERNLRFKSLSFKSFFSADASSLENEVFFDLGQPQDTEKKTSITHSPRFYISSSDVSENTSNEDIYNITHRRYTL